ncbi:MAG TPA: glycosyltransferase family 4 protein [Streptosporangiaceae bacterium]|nr:glycosyltransferase family 4 protein [Streptosporangiaceae bacterium]
MSAEGGPSRPPAPAGTRGRIVMLVDNGVDGDSRVQKTARSAAAAGWDVVLIGRSPDNRRQTRSLGEAEVWLIPVPGPLRQPRHEYRRAPLRSPLAYPSGPLAAYRKQRVKAWRTDLYMRDVAIRLAAGRGGRRPGPRVLIRRARLIPLRLIAKLLGRWVMARARRTDALRRRRTRLDARLDRLTTRLWRSVLGVRCWRRLDPHLWDWELAYGKVIDELAPDLIHANDFRMLGVGARAALRARVRGRPVKLVWDAHEFLPGIKPWSDNPRWHPAQCAYEREYAPYADAVITVSETLADLLVKEHGLPVRPAVVLNTPETARRSDREPPGLRALCGVGPDDPLVVYSGAAIAQRGLDVMIKALPRLDGVHAALIVARPAAPYVRELLALAAELGVGDRVHALPYVPHDQVVPFLSAADAGVIPIHHWPNHEIALITKFFEYSHARLPIVVSDVETMAEVTRSTGQGEVFTAEDVDDYVRAVQAVLADPKRYRAAYDAPGLLERWTWEAQAETLDQIYGRLLRGGPARAPERTAT